MSDTLWEDTEAALAAIRVQDDREPSVALVLGSGLGAYADTLDDRTVISYADIPGFQQSTVSGHSGELVFGSVAGLTVVVMKGRVHLYEGYGVKAVTFPLRVLRRAGATTLIITNAAGGINPSFAPGDLVALEDHLNLTGQNPLFGPNDDRFGPRFPDVSEPYDAELRRIAFEVAGTQGFTLKSGCMRASTDPATRLPPKSA
jgi:purine-nucleoside phosphorylase